MHAEGDQVNYLFLLQRIPGRRTPTRKDVTWVVQCQLCGCKTSLRLRSPPQLSCGCIRYTRFREIHRAYLRLQGQKERVQYITEINAK